MSRHVLNSINVLVALQNKWCSVEDILNSLTDASPSWNNIRIYHDLCLFTFNQYVNSKHFLSFSPKEYLYVYACCHGDFSLPVNMDDKNSPLLSELLPPHQQLPKEVGASDYLNYIKKHFEKKTVVNFFYLSYPSMELKTKQHMEMALIGNMPVNINMLSDTRFSELMTAAFEKDRLDVVQQLLDIDLFIPLSDDYSNLLTRIDFLSHLSLSYYELLEPKIKNLVEQMLEISFPRFYDSCELYNTLHVSSLSFINHLSPLAKAIYSLRYKEQMAYYLGFPIHIHNVSNREIAFALTKLSTIGEESYIKEIYENNKRQFEVYGNPVNDTDVVTLESAYYYSPLDIIPYIRDGKTYVYTRQQTENVKSKLKDNHNVMINPTFVGQLQSRTNMANTINLSIPLPLSDLYQNLLSSPKHEEPVIQPEIQQPNQDMINMVLNQLFAGGAAGGFFDFTMYN
jgi:hypothetical protein